MNEFVLATANPDKASEIALILGDSVRLLPRPRELADIAESGETLLENARIKALATSAATQKAAIADDTGLEVEALAGAPGVYSARYAGEHATYRENVEKLIHELSDFPEPRAARFRTVAIAVFPDGCEVSAEGIVEGCIALAPRGSGGFGYDPVFIPADAGDRTFAEMTPAEKSRMSHRGLAFRALRDGLLRSP